MSSDLGAGSKAEGGRETKARKTAGLDSVRRRIGFRKKGKNGGQLTLGS